MSSKDSALFEVRKHNFSVLLSDDEEVDTKTPVVEASSEGTQQKVAVASAASDADDGFTTVCKAKKPSGAKARSGSVPSSGSAPASTQGHFKPFPKELIIPKPETSLEFFDFPATLRTGDLRKLLQAYEGHYRLKWNHDTSCFVVFDDSALVEPALNQLISNDQQVKVRRYEEPATAATTAEVKEEN